MRAILIDWLVQVNLKFRLLQETMYMTVGIIDRFLQVWRARHMLVSIPGLKTKCVCLYSTRTNQFPRSSCSLLVSQPCFLHPNMRRCILLKFQTLLMWLTTHTPLHKLETWRWPSWECSNSNWVAHFPYSSSVGLQKYTRFVEGKAMALVVIYFNLLMPYHRWLLNSTHWQNTSWSLQWLTMRWFTSHLPLWEVLLWHWPWRSWMLVNGWVWTLYWSINWCILSYN